MAGPAKRYAQMTRIKMEPTMTIARRGDVILRLEKDGEAVSDVLVSSVALGLASPVFEAMFSDRFAEGQSLSAESPRTVPLPDDDPVSMLLICRIAHLQTAGLPERLTPIALADFAVACDKYRCNEAVQAWSKVWVTVLLKYPYNTDFDKVLFATYVLDLPHEFNTATIILIRDRSSYVKISHATHGHDFLPVSVFDKLLCDKRQSEKDAYRTLDILTSALGGTCDGSKKTIGNLIMSLQKAQIWLVGTLSVSQLKFRIAHMGDIPIPSCPTFNCGVCSNAPQIKTHLTLEMVKVYNSVKGLCLDCIKREALGGTRACRVRHAGAVMPTS